LFFFLPWGYFNLNETILTETKHKNETQK
jgi:hypothetical protein